MSYRVILNGVEISCDTPDEVRALVAAGGVRVVAKKVPKPGVEKSWDEARRLAKQKGISVTAARAELTKKRQAKGKQK